MLQELKEKRNHLLLNSICAILFIIVLLSRILYLTSSSFVVGLDGYYYALQIDSARELGTSFFTDSSLLWPFLQVFRALIPNTILSNKVAASVLSALSSVTFFLILVELLNYLKLRLWRLQILAGIFTIGTFLSYSQIYMTQEFLKNNLGQFLMLLGFLFLLKALTHRKKKIVVPKRTSALFLAMSLEKSSFSKYQLTLKAFFYGSLAILIFLISFFTHRISTILSVISILIMLWLILFTHLRRLRGKGKLGALFLFWLLSLGSLIALLLIIDRIPVITERLGGSLSLENLKSHFVDLLSFSNQSGEALEHWLLHLGLVPLIYFSIRYQIQEHRNRTIISALTLISLFLLNPLLPLTTDFISYRFILMAGLPLSLAYFFIVSDYLNTERPFPWKRHPHVLGYLGIIFIIVLVGAIITIDSWQLYKDKSFPDYEALYEDWQPKLDQWDPEKPIIAKRGFAGFIWYELGIRSEIFLPPDPSRYWRLVENVGPEVLISQETDQNSNENMDDATNGQENSRNNSGHNNREVFMELYSVNTILTLVPEPIWQDFYHRTVDRSTFLKNGPNLMQDRPESGYDIDDQLANRGLSWYRTRKQLLMTTL